MSRISVAIFLSVCCLSARAEEPPATLKEITVSGKRDAVAERREANTQKVIVTRQDIENMGVMTISEVLGKLPGVEVGSGAPQARGMARDSVQILVDGERPAGGARIVAGVVGRLPAGDLERVEILRGSSAEYGGAAAVTVNLVMKRALPKRSTALKAALGFKGKEPATQFTWTENGGEGAFGWTLPVTLNLFRSPGHTLNERRAEPGGVTTLWQRDDEQSLFTFREFVLSPRLSWKSGSDSLTISPLLFDGLGNTTGDSALTDLLTATAAGTRHGEQRNHRRLLRLRAEGEMRRGEAKVSGRLAFNHAQRTLQQTRTGSVTFSEQSASRENEINGALRLDQPLGEGHLLAASVEYLTLRRGEEQTLSGVTSNYTEQERQLTLWGQDDWSMTDKLTLTYGLRGESAWLGANGSAQQHGLLLPSVALRWEPAAQWLWRTSLGAGLKMPRLDEISNVATLSVAANTPLEADRRGNPALRPERSLNYEAVLERYLAGEAGVLGMNLYVRSTRDFTERRVQLEGTRWVERPQNEGDALHWGLELDGKVRTDAYGWKGATVKAHLTLPQARVRDARLGLTRNTRELPRYLLSGGVEQSLPALRSSYGLTLQLTGRSVTEIPGEQYGITQARGSLDGFWLYKLHPLFNLRISAQNLLAADTVRDMTYVNGADRHTLHREDTGYRAVLFTLEGRW